MLSPENLGTTKLSYRPAGQFVVGEVVSFGVSSQVQIPDMRFSRDKLFLTPLGKFFFLRPGFLTFKNGNEKAVLVVKG